MKRLPIAAVALAASLAAFPAMATQVVFDFTSVDFFGDPSASGHWTLDLSPTPSADFGVEFLIDAPISGEFDAGGVIYQIDSLGFRALIAGGGFDIVYGPDSFFSAFDGPVLFTGLTSAPTFKLGTFSPFNSTLTISETAVPEPATWGLMILGFGAVGAALRRRGRALRLA
jgi:hypothetical protein